MVDTDIIAIITEGMPTIQTLDINVILPLKQICVTIALFTVVCEPIFPHINQIFRDRTLLSPS